MNKRAHLLCILAATLLGLVRLSADPLIVLPSGDLACSVVVTSHPSTPVVPPPAGQPAPKVQAPNGPVMTAIQITQVKSLRQDVITWSDGSKSETWTWLDTGMTLAERTVGQNTSIYDIPKGSPLAGTFMQELLAFDPASVAWITEQTRTSEGANTGGKQGVHYRTIITRPSGTFEAGAEPLHVVLQAWINPKTLIPLAFDDGDNLYDLTFAPEPPHQPLVPPDRFQKELQRYYNASATLRHL